MAPSRDSCDLLQGAPRPGSPQWEWGNLRETGERALGWGEGGAACGEAFGALSCEKFALRRAAQERG